MLERLGGRDARFGQHRGGGHRQFLRGLASEVDGVYGGELLLVEDGRVAADLVYAEPLGELVGGEDFLVCGVPRTEQRQVVKQRLR
jgi:hypothetical protein